MCTYFVKIIDESSTIVVKVAFFVGNPVNALDLVLSYDPCRHLKIRSFSE